MQCHQACWEDDENNRRVAVSMNYHLSGDQIEITQVTPTQVTFFCSKTGQPNRTIGVRTETGRRVLRRAFEAARQLDLAKRELEDRHAMSLLS